MRGVRAALAVHDAPERFEKLGVDVFTGAPARLSGSEDEFPRPFLAKAGLGKSQGQGPPGRQEYAWSRSGGALTPVKMSCVRADSMLINPELRRAGPDSEGYYSYDKARGGSYRINVIAPGHFPGEWVETLTTGETRKLVLSLRRLGNLEIRVQSADGIPIAGSFVGVTDQETGRSVGDWIARGFVQSSSPDQTTDKNGKLTLRNLPTGKFTLELPGTARVVTVPPGPDGVKVVLTQL